MATRFRLPSANLPPVSPAFQSYTHAGSPQPRRNLPTTDSTTLSTATQTPDAADHLVAGDTFHSQFVSAPLAAQTFTSGDAFKYAVQATEANAGNNLFVQVWMGIYTNDGATLQATIRSKVIDDLEIATGGVASRFQSSTLSGTYTCAANERLVIEFSVSGTPTAAGSVQGHNASIRWGGGGAGGDILESDGQTGTTLNPWLEFTTTVVFPTTASGDGASAGVGASSVVGAATAASPASAAGLAASVVVGLAIVAAVCSATGLASDSVVGASTSAATYSGSGVATDSTIGASTAASTSTAAGVASETVVGASTAASPSTAAGVATVDGVGSTVGGVTEGTAAAAGAATVTGVGESTWASTSTATGTSVIDGVGDTVGGAVVTEPSVSPAPSTPLPKPAVWPRGLSRPFVATPHAVVLFPSWCYKEGEPAQYVMSHADFLALGSGWSYVPDGSVQE